MSDIDKMLEEYLKAHPETVGQPRWGQPMQHTLNELEAFDVMRAFILAYWKRAEDVSLQNLRTY